MAFTLALFHVPSFPEARSKIINADGTPSQEFYTFLRQLEAWAERIQAGLGESGATSYTVATLPTAVGKTGVRYMVTDATATTFMSTVAGGGANIVPVVSNGTSWKIG